MFNFKVFSPIKPIIPSVDSPSLDSNNSQIYYPGGSFKATDYCKLYYKNFFLS